MTTPKRRLFVGGLTGVLFGLLVVLYVFDHLTPDLYFVFSFVGFLSLIELTDPPYVRPQWRRRLRVFVVIGLFVFGYFIVIRFQGLFASV